MKVGTQECDWWSALLSFASVLCRMGMEAAIRLPLGPAPLVRLRSARHRLPRDAATWTVRRAKSMLCSERASWAPCSDRCGKTGATAFPILEPPHGLAHQPTLPCRQDGVCAHARVAVPAHDQMDGRVVVSIADAVSGSVKPVTTPSRAKRNCLSGLRCPNNGSEGFRAIRCGGWSGTGISNVTRRAASSAGVVPVPSNEAEAVRPR